MLFIKKKAKEAEMKKMKAVEAEQPKPETVKCPKCGAELDKQRVKRQNISVMNVVLISVLRQRTVLRW